ncbi:MAG: hypothetical protein HY954_07180 [Deltaproteobacteria bacterium]|nr:hypothetical protein [Deltaproteobacteria bacterium]
MTDLYNHQREAIPFAIKNDGNCALFHDPGLGKTRTCLEVFTHYRLTEPGLRLFVVCPLSLVNSAWGEDIRRFTDFTYAPFKVYRRPYMPLSETRLKNKVVQFIKKNYPNAWLYKVSDRFTAGIPDLIICKEGVFYAIELKVGSNKATPIQSYVLRQIRFAGGRAAVCRSVEDVKRLIEKGGDGDG